MSSTHHENRADRAVRVRTAVAANDVYSIPVLILGAAAILLSVILLTYVAVIEFSSVWRSIAAGAAVVALSTGLTVFVSTLMFRIAPAATAPALALLYLVKVVVMGWYLLSVGAPPWLHSFGFALAVAVCLVLSWLVLAPIAMRASAVLAEEYQAVVRSQEQQAAAETEPESPRQENSSEPTDGGEHGRP